MPTSATGISISSRASGFTLVEILVVVVIIAVMATGALLSLSTVGEDRGLQNESDRLFALMTYAREQGELQTREYGIHAFEGGYDFVAYDATGAKWIRVPNDDVLRTRVLPQDMTIAVKVEGRRVVLPKAKDPKSKSTVEDLTPQAMLFSSGELNAFEVFLVRPVSGKGQLIAADDTSEEITKTEMKPGAI
jgi:general secretion pathway protein H